MDERYCGDCELFRPYFGPQEEIDGCGKCESTGRIMHEIKLFQDCVYFVEDMEGE